jgi:hypothetical protein
VVPGEETYRCGLLLSPACPAFHPHGSRAHHPAPIANPLPHPRPFSHPATVLLALCVALGTGCRCASAGMAFQSGVAAVNSTPHLALTWLVAVVLVACILLFLGMLSVEVWRSVQFARRMHAVLKASAGTSPVGRASRAHRSYTDNPLKARPLPSAGTVVTVAGPQVGPMGQPPDKASGGAHGQHDAFVRVFTLGRPPPPPPSRDEGAVGGLVAAIGRSAAAAATALDLRRSPGSATSSESVKAGRNGRVRRLRNAMVGASGSPSPPPVQPPLPELPSATSGGGADQGVGH